MRWGVAMIFSIFSKRKRRRRGRRRRMAGWKRDLKIYGIITVVCFVTAASLTSFIDLGRTLIDRFNSIPWEALEEISNARNNTAYRPGHKGLSW